MTNRFTAMINWLYNQDANFLVNHDANHTKNSKQKPDLWFFTSCPREDIILVLRMLKSLHIIIWTGIKRKQIRTEKAHSKIYTNAENITKGNNSKVLLENPRKYFLSFSKKIVKSMRFICSINRNLIITISGSPNWSR